MGEVKILVEFLEIALEIAAVVVVLWVVYSVLKMLTDRRKDTEA